MDDALDIDMATCRWKTYSITKKETLEHTEKVTHVKAAVTLNVHVDVNAKMNAKVDMD